MIGNGRARVRRFYGALFGWEFDTSGPVSAAVSQAGNYGFVDRIPTGDGGGIPGGVGGGPGYDGPVIFYVGGPNLPAPPPKAESPRGKGPMGPHPAPPPAPPVA